MLAAVGRRIYHYELGVNIFYFTMNNGPSPGEYHPVWVSGSIDIPVSFLWRATGAVELSKHVEVREGRAKITDISDRNITTTANICCSATTRMCMSAVFQRVTFKSHITVTPNMTIVLQSESINSHVSVLAPCGSNWVSSGVAQVLGKLLNASFLPYLQYLLMPFFLLSFLHSTQPFYSVLCPLSRQHGSRWSKPFQSCLSVAGCKLWLQNTRCVYVPF